MACITQLFRMKDMWMSVVGHTGGTGGRKPVGLSWILSRRTIGRRKRRQQTKAKGTLAAYALRKKEAASCNRAALALKASTSARSPWLGMQDQVDGVTPESSVRFQIRIWRRSVRTHTGWARNYLFSHRGLLVATACSSCVALSHIQHSELPPVVGEVRCDVCSALADVNFPPSHDKLHQPPIANTCKGLACALRCV